MPGLDMITNPQEGESVIIKGFIAEDATSPNDQIHVLIPSYDMSRQFGPTTFSPRPLMDNSVLLPSRNDPCLIALDEDDNAELVSWWAEDPTNATNRVTQAEFDAAVAALDSRLDTLEVTGGFPEYDETTLPISATANKTAVCSIAGFRFLLRYNTAIGSGAWEVIGGTSELNASGTPSSLIAGTGWRQPTPTNVSLTLPLAGSWMLQGMAEMIYNVAESIGGVGIAPQSVSGTTSPTVIGTGGQGSVNFRIQTWTLRVRVAGIVSGTSDIYSIRVNTGASATVAFARAAIYARPVYVLGVV